MWQLVAVHFSSMNAKHGIPYIAKIYTFQMHVATLKFKLIAVCPLSSKMMQYCISFTNTEFPIKSPKTIFQSAPFQ
jgi:hypothetical protein